MKETYGEKEKNLLKQFDEELKNKENILSNICDERDKILEKQRKKEQKLDVFLFSFFFNQFFYRY